MLALVVGYFFLPYDIRTWIPVWLPFLAALGLEIDFFVGGWLKGRSGEAEPSPLGKHGPQPRDLADFGGPSWQEAFTVEHDGEQILVPAIGAPAEEDGGLADEERASRSCGGGAPAVLGSAMPWAAHAIEAAAAVAIVAGDPLLRLAPARLERGLGRRIRPAPRRSSPARRRRSPAIPAAVTCDTSGRFVGFAQDADGLAFVGGSRAYLTPGICDASTSSPSSTGAVVPADRRARSPCSAHEAWHLQGVANEGLANCYAFQSGVPLGVDLGLSEGTARAMMREQLAANASDAERQPRATSSRRAAMTAAPRICTPARTCSPSERTAPAVSALRKHLSPRTKAGAAQPRPPGPLG